VAHLISAAIDPGHPAHGDAMAEFSDIYGESAGLEGMRPTPFDIGEINQTLAGLTLLDGDDRADSGAGQDRDFQRRQFTASSSTAPSLKS
jgi:hypothetical protein